ncbi:hypothetical protein E3N88_15161 [Mikania micrantha]|uniref:Ubiquitin-like protease family profile domain-containing protein n=1 Tax=Mikania micrantha TaxID=192012 RepID=A0A5N6NWI1_9ASTR|nr:hypothetical protein E3N88_15161 [Mikania micrantha]
MDSPKTSLQSGMVHEAETEIGTSSQKVVDAEMELDQNTIDYCLEQLTEPSLENVEQLAITDVTNPENPISTVIVRTKKHIDWMLNKEGVDPKQRLEKFTNNMSGMIGANNNIKVFDMVFFPILEFGHYYLLVFELKNSAISVIDNFHESIPLVGVKDNAHYDMKYSPYKVIFVEFLERTKHPKTDEIHATQIQKVHIPWATKTNVVDCGIFMMRHMEKFMGSREQFNCGFSTNGKKKKCQLNMLRKKILLHIIRSEVNTIRDVVLEGTRGV